MKIGKGKNRRMVHKTTISKIIEIVHSLFPNFKNRCSTLNKTSKKGSGVPQAPPITQTDSTLEGKIVTEALRRSQFFFN